MNILLIEPPPIGESRALRILGSLGTVKADFVWEPLDLTIISGLLRKNGIESTIYDANANRSTFGDLEKTIEKEKPNIVIFTTSTSTIYNDLKVVDVVKKVSKDIVTVAIGTHVSALPKETLELTRNLDIVVFEPEPELSILNLIKNKLNPKNVLGLYYRKNRKIIKNKSQPKEMNLDNFGFPAHDKLDLNLYYDPFQKRKPMVVTYGSRGCWWGKCIYCSCPPFFQPLRKRSISHIIEELKWITNDLSVQEIKWFDAELNCDIIWLTKLCDAIIKNKINLSWSCNARVDKLPYKLLNKMKIAGCHTVHIGVESADLNILKNIQKGITPKQVERTVENIKKSGLNVVTYFMLGLPGETMETMKKTLDFAKRLGTDATTFSIATPHPSTYFYDWIEKNHLFITKNFSKFDPCLPPVFNLNDLSSEEIYKFMKYAYRNFYFRPKYIMKKILKTRKLIEIKNGLKNFLLLIQKYGFEV